MNTPPRLDLPDWGPYSKRLIGISHLPDRERGLRFDLSVFPGLYRRMVKIPAVRYESDYHPWEASADMGYFSHRHVIDGRERLFTDITFATLDAGAVAIRARTENLTDEAFLGVLHFMASLQFPPVSPNFDITLVPAAAELPPGAEFRDAAAYDAIETVCADPRRHLPWGGGPCLVGSRSGAVGGFGIYLRKEAGDVALSYDIHLPHDIRNPDVSLRHQSPKPERVEVSVDGIRIRAIDLPANDEFVLTTLAALPGPLTAGNHRIGLRFPCCAKSFLDGILIAEHESTGIVRFAPQPWNPVPAMERVGECGLLLSYADTPVRYGLAWDFSDTVIRQIRQGDLDPFLRDRVHDHVNETLGKDPDWHHANVFLRPLRWAPRSTSEVDGLVCCGSADDVREKLLAFARDPRPFSEALAGHSRRKLILPSLPEGEPYRFSQERMAATALLGVVYPVRCRGEWITHFTPGRWWDSLYTWDAGFTALGLGHLAPAAALAHVAAYLVPPDAPDQTAFVHYGTPVPTQLYAFKEIWQREPDIETLRAFFPRLVRYHRFLAGRFPNSTTRPFASGLIATWDYFYNTGGWDDYPPQQWVHQNKLTGSVAPIANTAHAVRTAKQLATFARLLCEPDDEFLADIAELSASITDHAWDEQSGYFGYVCHDADGRPAGLLRSPEGANFNMGMDGLTPLIAGVGSPEQRRRMVEKLAGPRALMTPIGLTTVDQSAPYYRRDGYWNGAVWMPHQWFFWKVLLDLGETDLAFEIARRALDVWKEEVEASWNCFEHFIVETGRGAGWHQFTGLSCPVLDWFAAYYRPGTITIGHHATVVHREDGPNGSLRIGLVFDPDPPAPTTTVLVVLPPASGFDVTINGATVVARERHPACLEIEVPSTAPAEVHVQPTIRAHAP